MESKKQKLLDAVKNKSVLLATHWDADGVTSAAMIYHLIKDTAKEVSSISKGDTFVIEANDVKGEPEIVICIDIHPSLELDPHKIIYIDHHPNPAPELFLLSIHDKDIQSCSLLVWQELLNDSENPYFVMLTLLGYFGDGGQRSEIPQDLLEKANTLIPDLMEKRKSYYSKEDYYRIEMYVSLLNTGKRMHWCGDVPLIMLKEIEKYEDFVNFKHPLAEELKGYKEELKFCYNKKVELFELENIIYGIIESEKNIQGVLCAKNMKEKPILIMNKFKENVIGSLRVPDNVDFDGGIFLSRFNEKITSFRGGGHEKAGGFTISQDEFSKFLEILKDGV